ncbi:MAG: hypothetical protein K2F95_03945 [Alistipes sp.]|nr:hypothetical protein [Alistipes sp.]
MKRSTAIAICALLLAAVCSCDKNQECLPEKEYPETGPIADGYICIDAETAQTITFAYKISVGYVEDSENNITTYSNRLSLFAESMFLSPINYKEWTAQTQMTYTYVDDWHTEKRISERMDIYVPQQPFDKMELSIERVDGAMILSDDIVEVVELTQNNGASYVYQPWFNTNYSFWSEYCDVDLTVHLRVKGDRTLKIVCSGQMLSPTFYY